MTNQRRINRSQGTINDSQGTINDEQGVINEKSKVDFSITGFGGLLVFIVTVVFSMAAIYFGITAQMNMLAYKLDELTAKVSLYTTALNNMEMRMTAAEARINLVDKELKIN